MYRYADGALKNYLSLKQDTQNFVSHAWLSDEKVIVGNNRAELFLIQNCEILAEYKIYDVKELERKSSSNSVLTVQSSETNKAHSDIHSVTSIVSYSKGFIASCGKGKAYLYDKIDDKEFYRKIRDIKIPPDQYSNDPSKTEDQSITSMCISPSEETLLVATNWQQIYQLVFSNVDVSKVIII